MSIFTLRNYLLIGIFSLSSLLFSAEQESLLHLQDINKVMQQLFDQHVDKKEISATILKNSFRVYIDQFDPDRIYLLEQEINPFLNMNESDINKNLERYRKGEFVEYNDLNLVIQRAIYRAEQYRKVTLRNEVIGIIQAPSSEHIDNNDGWSDPDLKLQFTNSLTALHERQKKHFTNFIALERKRYDRDYLISHADSAFKVYDEEIRIHENQYLFLKTNGQPMSEAEKQNTLALHILKALANALDAHTSVMSSLEAADMRVRLEKELPGIGIQFQPKPDGTFMIVGLSKGGPAEKDGHIKINDELISVDGTPVSGKAVDAVLEMIRGKEETKVTIVVKHPNAQEDSAILTRKDITLNEDRALASSENFEGGIIGKIKLDAFYQGEEGVSSEEDVRAIIEKFKKQGDLKGLILDFRENSGGFLSQAIKVAGLFISNGVVVISQYFNGEKHVFRDLDGKTLYNGPLIILTSKATASAAEIVAQALQDYGVALIVGDEHTYGKGTIQSQTITDKQGGSTFFKVTVGKYYTVSGKTPQIQGVKADIVVPSQFMHEKLGEEYLDYPLKQDTISASYTDSLDDIDPKLKSWFMHYYTPSLQHKVTSWDDQLPTLKQNSASRIAGNEEFQKFIKGQSDEFDKDFQMDEAVNIIKDMIILEQKSRYDTPKKVA